MTSKRHAPGAGRPRSDENFLKPILKRGVRAGWEFRRQIPSDLKDHLGRNWWFRAWPVDCPEQIVQAEAKALRLRTDRTIAEYRKAQLEAQIENIDVEAQSLKVAVAKAAE